MKKQEKFIANHNFLFKLKREAYPEFMASLAKDMQDTARLKQTFTAEFRYLARFQDFLTGIPLTEQYRLFDGVLSLAPWNDSLRARILLSTRISLQPAETHQNGRVLCNGPIPCMRRHRDSD